MSRPSDADSIERQWTQARFHDYLLHRLGEEDEERVLNAVVQIPGLADELEVAEERLIQSWLDGRVAPDDLIEFQRYYVNGSETNRAKLAVFQALRTAKSQPSIRSVKRPIPFRAPSGWAAGVAAALLLAGILGVLLYRENGRNEIKPIEQQAGISPQGGLTLLPGDSGKVLRIPSIPDRLIWTVTDYRQRYRIRVSSSSEGQEQASSLLDPKDNSVEFAPDRSSPLPLPWRVSILTPDGAHEKIVARYTLVKR